MHTYFPRTYICFILNQCIREYDTLFPTAKSCWVSISRSRGWYCILPCSSHACVFPFSHVCAGFREPLNLVFQCLSLRLPACLPLCLPLCFPVCFPLVIHRKPVCHCVSHLSTKLFLTLCRTVSPPGTLEPFLPLCLLLFPTALRFWVSISRSRGWCPIPLSFGNL